MLHEGCSVVLAGQRSAPNVLVVSPGNLNVGYSGGPRFALNSLYATGGDIENGCFKLQAVRKSKVLKTLLVKVSPRYQKAVRLSPHFKNIDQVTFKLPRD